jgi:hypothetical protein
MTDRYIRAMLRAATAAGILTGWQGPHLAERSYTVAPAAGDAGEWPRSQVMEYVHTLEIAGVDPLYRDSEPLEV